MKKIFILAAFCGLYAGCTQAELPDNVDNIAGDNSIRLNVVIDGETRAGWTGENLDTFQLIIDNKTDSDYSCNLLMRKTDGVWAAADGAALKWNPEAAEATVYAFAPAKEGVNPAEVLAVEIPADQSSEEAVKAADFLLGRRDVDFSATDGALDITLEHKLSRLVIKSAAGITNVKVNGAVLRGTCDLASEIPAVTPAAGGEAGSIIPLNTGNAYECILMPQSTAGLTVSYTVGSTEYEFKFEEGRLEPGMSYPVALKYHRPVALDRTGWAVTGKFEEREWGNNVRFSYVLDGDFNTYLETDWNGPNSCDQPVLLVIDTKEEQNFTNAGIMLRNEDSGRHNYTLEFYVSSDDRTWWNFDHDTVWEGITAEINRSLFNGWKSDTNWESQENWTKVGGPVTLSDLRNPEVEYIDLDGSKSGRYFIIKCPQGGRGERDILEIAEVYLCRGTELVTAE